MSDEGDVHACLTVARAPCMGCPRIFKATVIPAMTPAFLADRDANFSDVLEELTKGADDTHLQITEERAGKNIAIWMRLVTIDF